MGGGTATATAVDAGHESGTDPSEAPDEREGSGSRDLPVSAATATDRSSERGVGGGHHVHADASGSCVSGGGDGLVQSANSVVAPVEHAGRELLRGGTERGAGASRLSHGVQYRSGIAVHQSRVSGGPARSRHRHQHGWQGLLAGQHDGGEVLAIAQVRMRASPRV